MKMKRYAFVTATGATCCTSDDPKLLCTHCRAALAADTDDGGTPPDPYKEDIERLRREPAKGGYYYTPPDLSADDAVPDPYAAGLAKMREENR